MVTRSKQLFGLSLVALVATGLWLGASSSRVRSWLDELTSPSLPPAENANVALNVNTLTNSAGNTNGVTPLPSEKNLAVPFTSQAPSANWDQDHEEFCEEAAMVMVARFFAGRSFTDINDKEASLQAVKRWEVEHLGWYYDTTVAENATVLRGLFDLQVEVVTNPTVDDIKRAVAQGHPVIVPAAGRELGNPNFTAPGPIYHNLVIRGYTTSGQFITNDPGTRKGEAYVYDQDVIMSAMHDWVPAGERTTPANGQANGRKAVLIVRP